MNSPAVTMATLESIEIDLAHRQNEFAAAAGNRARLVRDVEKAIAIEYARATGNTTDRRMTAQAVVGQSQDYADLTAAEAAYDAAKAAVGVLTTRASIGQTLLRTLREAG